MKQALIEAIWANEPEIMKLFAGKFDRSAGWDEFLRENPSVGSKLNGATPITAAGFQAIYIACWIFQPLEKGSFMIALTEPQKAKVQRDVNKLSTRISSHLDKVWVRTGGKGFEFVKGYNELLVILSDNYLFLKMEGEKATKPSHASGWWNMKKTGHGNTRNYDLNELAMDSVKSEKYGIAHRLAENFNPEYKKLLEALGFKGKMVTFNQVIQKLRGQMPLFQEPADRPMGPWLRSLVIDHREFFPDPKIKAALKAAEKDLEGIIRSLEAEAKINADQGFDQWGVNHLFQEVRVAPADLDLAMKSLADKQEYGF